ncbi:MAG: hypothetical protein V4812_14620 [Pseudomonadota bacterium]
MPEHPGHIAPGASSNSTVETDGSPARQTDYYALPDYIPVLNVTGCDYQSSAVQYGQSLAHCEMIQSNNKRG